MKKLLLKLFKRENKEYKFDLQDHIHLNDVYKEGKK